MLEQIVDAVSLDDGLTTTDPAEAFTKKLAMGRATQVVLLADSRKFGSHSFVQAGDLDAADADPRTIVLAPDRLDFWQADGRGRYDNAGYRLRGVQRTDATGAFRLVTVIPGQYPGRTEHVHVKITPPGGSTFTTQLYFPGSAHNDEDGPCPRRWTTFSIPDPGCRSAATCAER